MLVGHGPITTVHSVFNKLGIDRVRSSWNSSCRSAIPALEKTPMKYSNRTARVLAHTKFSTQFSRDRSSLAQCYRMAHVTLDVPLAFTSETTIVTSHQDLINSNLGTPFRESATETVVRILVHGSSAML